MSTSTPGWYISPLHLTLAPYYAAIAAAAAVALAFYVPFFPAFLIVAAILGVVSFGLAWVGSRQRIDLGLIGAPLVVIAFVVSSRIILPHGIVNAERWLTAAQFLAVWLLASEGLPLSIS